MRPDASKKISIRDARREDAGVISRLFMDRFFTWGKYLYPILYILVRRDVINRIGNANSTSFVGLYNGTVISVFRAVRQDSYWLVDSFLIGGHHDRLTVGQRIELLKSWAAYLACRLQDEDGKITLVFESGEKKHARGYAMVFKKLGFQIDYTSICGDSDRNSKNNTYRLRLVVWNSLEAQTPESLTWPTYRETAH